MEIAVTLARARAAVEAAREAPNTDLGWADALIALGAGLGLDRCGRTGVPLAAVVELLEAGAALAVLVGRGEVLLVDGPGE